MIVWLESATFEETFNRDVQELQSLRHQTRLRQKLKGKSYVRLGLNFKMQSITVYHLMTIYLINVNYIKYSKLDTSEATKVSSNDDESTQCKSIESISSCVIRHSNY